MESPLKPALFLAVRVSDMKNAFENFELIDAFVGNVCDALAGGSIDQAVFITVTEGFISNVCHPVLGMSERKIVAAYLAEILGAYGAGLTPIEDVTIRVGKTAKKAAANCLDVQMLLENYPPYVPPEAAQP